jgi:hypothetical protein
LIYTRTQFPETRGKTQEIHYVVIRFYQHLFMFF